MNSLIVHWSWPQWAVLVIISGRFLFIDRWSRIDGTPHYPKIIKNGVFYLLFLLILQQGHFFR